MVDNDVLGVTSAGKEIKLVRVPNRSLVTLAFTSGGKLPKELDCAFSDRTSAFRAVENYLAKKGTKS